MTNLPAKSFRRMSLAIGLLLLVCAGQIASAQEPPAESYTLGVSDVLTVSIWKNPELAATAPVRPDGKVHLPLIGEVTAVGKTPAVLQQELTERYGAFVNVPAVSVLISEINSRKVYLIGQVNAPGAYDLLQPLKLLQVLATAGGMTEFAKKDQIIILRMTKSGETRIPVSVSAITTGKRLTDNLVLRPGDTVIVP